MDIEKLIERLRSHRGALFEMLYKQDMDDAATALSVLQAENEKLRDEAEGMRSNWYKSVEEIQKLRAELERVKRERDAAIADWHGFCVKCAWNGEQNLADGQMDDRCRTCKKNGKCNWEWRGKKED